MKTISAFLLACGILAAQAPQAPNPTTTSIDPATAGSVPIYRVTVVARTTKAINYNHRSGSTRIGFRGTALMPQAEGEAKVESKQGVIKIDAEMQKLDPATKFGPEYLTYVMWAITPEGRATNVGEVLLKDGKSKLDATTELQSFGLIITAEPYFAVTQPSDVVVMENFVRHDTVGTIEELDAKYELLQRGQYTLNVNPADIRPIVLDRKVPLELYEARNAVQIARWTGAPRYAADTFQKALDGLENAEGYLQGRAGRKPIGTVAREAVQMAEDARIITVKKIEEEQLANERQAGLDREGRAETARRDAQSETERVALEAERARIASEKEAGRVAREHDAQIAAAQADADRLKLASDARLAEAQSETNRLKRDSDAQALTAQAEADRLKRENDAQRATAQADLDRAAAEKAQAEADKAQLRAQLLLQFNAILETRDTARGLIVNMSDVLFDTAKYSLRPAAREKLARVAGILSGHPGLRLQVEGYTDSVGGDDYNQLLSENRASSVRDYLTGAGIPTASVTSKGFGKTEPVASNDTSAGRQQNRRVELVVSGDLIGSEIRPAPLAVK
ncbi:MAG: OmpA family protein [Bryobacteraceae bacterium]|jgi:outer membrane protein OmpA-like peptidoglycan-associated protein